MITLEIDDATVLARLAELSRRVEDLRPALKEMGEDLVATTQARFASTTAPDGSRWAPNSQTTILRYLARDGAGKVTNKKGKLNAKGIASVMGKKPLSGDSGNLADRINYDVVDGHTLLVGSPEKYAGVQQFGAARGSLGRGAPWGDIPARPFLGVSEEDGRSILAVLESYLVP
jgi:phage virion morphogenesis protein